MGIFKVSILGNGAAVPTSRQHPSSQLLQHNSKRFMIDCGEGTQMQMQRYKFSYRKLSHVFISHLHGDHYLGLMGMISTFNLFNRKDPLYVFGPEALKDVLDLHLKVSDVHLNYDLIFYPLLKKEVIYEDEKLTVSCFPLKHRIPTWGFLFKEKENSERNLNKEFIEKFRPGIEQIHKIKYGADFQAQEGAILKNEDITYFPKSLSYAYCCDTLYDEELIPEIRGVDLLYHEATFGNKNEAIAGNKFHSTAAQAATLAAKAGAGKLLLGHFSARYIDREELLDEARYVFPNSELSKEGETYTIV
ncbi:MAG: ribonuclease Z [Bacteroidales bacterium]|nr:ribonuclease Z [Bacteroidales bacterium]